MLYLVVGPSGVGKDTILDALKQALPREKVLFPKRHITRPADAGGEDHIAETTDSFAAKKAEGTFCLSWHAHNLDYGVPVGILKFLEQGRHVFVNVSRTVIEEAQSLPGEVCVLEINASPGIIRDRLRNRGRETEEEIEERVARAVSFAIPEGVQHLKVLNDGPMEDTIADLVTRIET